jgi:acetate kinase
MAAILTLNSGSGTIKFSVFAINAADNKITRIYFGLVDNIIHKPHVKIKTDDGIVVLDNNLAVLPAFHTASNPYEFAINELLDWLQQNNINIVAAGHRIAHGGTKCRKSVIINDEVISYLETLEPLAPLHQHYNLEGSKILKKSFPNMLQVACFDTSFHVTCDKLSQLFAIPKKYTEEGVRRYGFHGLSYSYIVSQFDHYLPKEIVNGKVIIAHLGQGASMCAVSNKKSVATTLGFSAVDGLPMGTRCGNIDPGVLLYFMKVHGMDYAKLEKLIYRESGLLGVSGISADMRTLLASESKDARLAVDLFVYKIGMWLGTLAAELQGLDAIIFTGGIGENAAPVREKIVEKAAWFGAKIDKAKNANNEHVIHAPDSKIFLYIIPTNEELTIAKDTLSFYLK